MSERVSQVKARRILGDLYVIPKDMNKGDLLLWWSKNKSGAINERDIEVISLLEPLPGEKGTIASSVEKGDFPLNKPRLMG